MNILPLTEVYDAAATACRKAMLSEGAWTCHTYQDGEFRVVYSIEPDGTEMHHHVSVSQNHVSVNNKILHQYAARLIPDFDQMEFVEANCRPTAAHAWWKRKAVTP